MQIYNELETISGGRSNDNSDDRFLRNMDGSPVSHEQPVSGWKKANTLRTVLGILNLGRTISLFIL